MKVLYLDCYSGISGDMFLGALLDAGLRINALRQKLSKLPLKGYRLKTKKVRRGQILSTKFEVRIDKGADNKERKLKDILSLIQKSSLGKDIKERASRIFKALAQAESKIHGKDLKDLHFHEVGDIDSIVDIVGAVIGLDILKIEKVFSSPVNVGSGKTVSTKVGILPLPAPAALSLLKGLPISHSNIESELVTPTGAALLAILVDEFVHFPPMILKEIGYGAGTYEFKERPNCLRVMIGESKKTFAEDNILVIEANIDDMSPVDYECLMERLFKEGALDVYLVPVQMKKTRPGILVTVLAKREDLDRLTSVIFNESTTIGVRYYHVQRKKLKRELKRISTKYGKVTLKVSSTPEGIRKIAPEYRDCKRIADSRNIPLREVRREIDKIIEGRYSPSP